MQIRRLSLDIYVSRLRRGLSGLWPGIRDPRGRGGGSAGIGRIIADLEELNQATERDFLAVGEKLMELRGAARRIASDMAALTELISGERGQHAVQSLDRVLAYSRAIHVRTEESGQALGNVRELAGRLRQGFSGLANMVATFRTLCTLTRIETSRLGTASADFGDLAEEVIPLSESIQASGQAVLEAAAALDRGVESSLRNASGLRDRQLRELPPLVAAATDGMRAFAGQQHKAAEASAGQTAGYESLCSTIEDLVRSIQFHDITRQQIEHVAGALRPLLSGAQPTRPLLTLQVSQLRSAAQVFASAVEGIEGDLEAVAVRLGTMAEASRSLMGATGNGHDSFFVRMEGCFTAILQAVKACAGAQAEMPATSRTIEELAERMRGSIAEIRGIEIRIRRIAINATIRSAHIGAGGDPLNVIADAMQKMVSSSSDKTEEAAAALDAVGDAARRLPGGEEHTGAEDACRQLQGAILEMRSASEVGHSRVMQIAEVGAGLAAGIGTLRDGFSAGELVADVLDRVCGELERMTAELPADEVAAPELEELARRYTMQAERDIHQLAVHGTPAAPVSPESLGDNVELF